MNEAQNAIEEAIVQIQEAVEAVKTAIYAVEAEAKDYAIAALQDARARLNEAVDDFIEGIL